MTQDEIIRMAREAGWPGIYAKPLLSITMQEDDFLRFAALVVAAEREACAKVCIEIGATKGNSDDALDMADACADAIRARGEG